MKILFEIERISIEEGGAAKMLVWVANQTTSHGHDVTIVTHKEMKDKLFDLHSNIKVIAYKPNNSPWYPIPQLRKTFRKERPDLIVSFMLDSNLYCLLASVGLHIPVIVCERNNPYINRPLKFKMAEKLCRFADGATYQLQKAADYYTWVKCPKIVIPNPVPPSKYKVTKSFSERKDEICNTARVVYQQKRTDLLIDAFKIVAEKYPQMKLVLYGGGKDMKLAVKRVKDYGIEDKVIFNGTVKNPIQYVVDSKLFVLSSDFEGISNSLAEAMSAGLPCISTDTEPGGSRLLIEDGKNGLISPRGDVKALSDKILYCLDNPQVCDRIGTEAAKLPINFSEEKIYGMWEHFFETIIKKEGSK